MGEMTNKDVLNDMLRKTFPNVIFIRSINEGNKTRAIHFSEEWLNEEYKEPKTGYWIGIDEEPHEDYECSCCGYVASTFTANIEPHTEYKYCPNCGCRMQESEVKE